MTIVRRLIFVFWLAALWAVESLPAANFSVTMSNFHFTPPNLTVNVGDSVTWTNIGGFHSTVSGTSCSTDGTWQGPLIGLGGTFTFTFTSPGSYPYFCEPHCGIGMVGGVTAVAPNVPPTISIDSPTNNAAFTAPANVTIQASASDSDGSVTQVEFFQNGNSIGIVTNPPYSVTLSGLSVGPYFFSATATDNSGSRASASVNVNVRGILGEVPKIAMPPQSQTVNVGSDALFTVQVVVGTRPLSYQWSFNQTAIAGATTSALTLTNVSNGDAGTYFVDVSNAFGATSASATLTVTNPPSGSPPTITAQPQSQTVNAGTNVTFSVNAIGSTPLNFQWFFNQSVMADATNSILVLSNLTALNAGNYFAIVSNAFGFATSSNATLTVIVPTACNFALSKTNASFTAAGGNGSVTVTTGSNCSWTISNTNGWIHILSGNGGTGTRTVTFSVAANAARTARRGVLVMAGKQFTVTESGLVFAAKNDFNHDGFSDFVWQNSDGRVALWLMNGVNISSAQLLRNGQPTNPDWQIVGAQDFDHDGNVDILWQNSSSGALAIWFMNGTSLVRAELISGPALGSVWRLVGVADFNRDGQSDFLFRHVDGYLLLWLMNGKNFISQQLLYDGDPVPVEWRVAGIANLNTDSQADILWQSADSSMVVWFMAGSAPTSGVLLSNLPQVSGQIAGFADFNQDGKTDFIWRHTDGHLFTWLMNGTNRVSEVTIAGGKIISGDWRLALPKN